MSAVLRRGVGVGSGESRSRSCREPSVFRINNNPAQLAPLPFPSRLTCFIFSDCTLHLTRDTPPAAHPQFGERNTGMFKNAARKIAHNTTVPGLAGRQDLRSLQDLITAEKAVLNSYVYVMSIRP